MNVGDEVKMVGRIVTVWPPNMLGRVVADVQFEGCKAPQQVLLERLLPNDNPADYIEDMQ